MVSVRLIGSPIEDEVGATAMAAAREMASAGKGGSAQVSLASPGSESGSPLPAALPKVELDSDEFNFGVMGVGEEATHTFVVRNRGAGTLKLQPGETTCKCTSLTIVDSEIPPGKEGKVTLQWKGDEASSEFHQGAALRTNDPQRRRILLRVIGRMTVLLGASPEEIVFSDVRGSEPRKQRVFVFSQEWEQFEIAGVRASMSNVTNNLSWEVSPADPESLAQLGARAGYAIDVTLDPKIPKGPFSGALSIDTKAVSADGRAQAKSMDLRVHGNRIGNVTFLGRIVDGDGFLDIGPVEQDSGAKHNVHLMIRNDRPTTTVTAIETTPDYLKVSVSPDSKSVPGRAWFRVEIQVPPGSPTADFMSLELAKIRLRTDDPENPEIDVRVRFAVFTK